jgi:hypothetical protein
MQEIGAGPTSEEIQEGGDQPSRSKPRKATRIQKLKENSKNTEY